MSLTCCFTAAECDAWAKRIGRDGGQSPQLGAIQGEGASRGQHLLSASTSFLVNAFWSMITLAFPVDFISINVCKEPRDINQSGNFKAGHDESLGPS